MSELNLVAYAVVFLGTALLSGVLTPVALRYAIKQRVLDHPGGHKSHESPIPYLGGVAIASAFSMGVAGVVLFEPPGGSIIPLLVLLGAAIVLSIVGLLDDVSGLSPWVRIGVEFLLAALVWWTGGGVALTEASWVNLALTVVWIVGITNAFNLLDNMDGLSAGVAAIASGWIFLIAAVNGQYAVAALAIGVTGCALGFLRHNFYPAKIYMGDSGSLFLGFLIAVLAIRLRFEAPTEVTMFVPIVILGVPILDTTLVVISRLTHSRGVFSGGRDHVSHRLVKVGIPVPSAVALIYGAAIGLGWLAFVMSRLDTTTGYLLMGFVISVSCFVGVLLGLVPVYETSRRPHMRLSPVTEDGEDSDVPRSTSPN